VRLRSRLLLLERAVSDRAPPPPADEPVFTDEEEADRTGEFLWIGLAIGKRYPRPGGRVRSAGGTPALRVWNEAAEAARNAGHRKYHVGLRPFALAVWLGWKPDILAHRRRHGVWVPTGDPVRAEMLTPEEFERLPLAERIDVLREHRPGYWSKHGPPARSRSRVGRRER
jgi:hypothetical protein